MNAKIFARLAKYNEVTGEFEAIAADETIDHASEVFDYGRSRPHFEKWSTEFLKATDGKSAGNVRAMHGKVAAGVLKSLEFNDESKSILVRGQVVDANEMKKMQAGVYTGVSIGGKYVDKWPDPVAKGVTRYEAAPFEISIVDLPCNPSATFTMVKADGATADVSLVGDPEAHAVDELAKMFDDGSVKPSELLTKLRADGDAVAKAKRKTDGEAMANAVMDEKITNGDVEKLAAVWMTDAERDAITGDGAVKSLGLLAALREVAKQLAPTGPVVEPKAGETTALIKSMYSVSWLADLVESLAFVQADAAWEAAIENDGSGVPAKIKALVAELANVLCEMCDEETQELTESAKAARAENLKKVRTLLKAGARHSKADLDRLQAIHDHSTGMGAKCADAEKAVPIGDLRKAFGLNADVADEAVTKHVAAVMQKAKNWDSLPAAPAGAASVVTKAQENANVTETESSREFEGLERAAASGDRSAFDQELMKVALRHGRNGAPR